MSAQGRSGAGGDGGDRGRMPRDMKDLLKICAEASSTNPDQDEVHSFDRMSPEVNTLRVFDSQPANAGFKNSSS